MCACACIACQFVCVWLRLQGCLLWNAGLRVSACECACVCLRVYVCLFVCVCVRRWLHDPWWGMCAISVLFYVYRIETCVRMYRCVCSTVNARSMMGCVCHICIILCMSYWSDVCVYISVRVQRWVRDLWWDMCATFVLYYVCRIFLFHLRRFEMCVYIHICVCVCASVNVRCMLGYVCHICLILCVSYSNVRVRVYVYACVCREYANYDGIWGGYS